jgi:two-component system response regulator MprA
MNMHPRVLVADDDRDLLDAVAAAVTEMGADVVRAETGGDLIERMADEGPFDLVITDIAMPWMNGLQALHAARTAGDETPVIVMTAMKSEHIPAQVEAVGKTLLLQKPFGLDELAEAVTRLLDRQGSS